MEEERKDLEWCLGQLHEMSARVDGKTALQIYEVEKVIWRANQDMQAIAQCGITCDHFLEGNLKKEPCKRCQVHGACTKWEWRGA
jgi:hypothetical protein